MKNRAVIAAVVAVMTIAGVVYGVVPEKVVPDTVAVLNTYGMTCGSCAGKIEKALKAENGVAELEVSVEGARVFVAIDSRQAKPVDLAAKVTAAGYASSVAAAVPAGEFRRIAGRDVGQKVEQASTGGCGCCNKKQ